MKKKQRQMIGMLLALVVLLATAMSVTAFAAGDPTEEAGTTMIECPDLSLIHI